MTTSAKRILVVDDDDFLTDLLLVSFSEYRVERVPDAEEALASIAHFQPDLLIVDLTLPGMDGMALATRLREDPKLKETPIVLASGAIAGSSGGDPVQIGGFASFPKPFRMNALKQFVKMCLTDPQAARQATANLPSGYVD